MAKRFFMLVACTMAVLALSASPALAEIEVADVTPSSGAAGQSVTCTVEGMFYTNNIVFEATTPLFELVKGATKISGTTGSYDSGRASVTFALPAAAPQGSYDLRATQSHKLYNVTFWTEDQTTKSNAFRVTAAPPPTVTAVNPTSVWAGCVKTDIVLTVSGTNFVNGSRIVMDSVETTGTAFVSATKLTVPLTPALMATPAASLMVTVRNPPFPPGTPSVAGLPLALQPETTTPRVTISGADGRWHNTPVALKFTAADEQSGVQKIQYMCAPAVPAWTDGVAYTVPTSTQGAVIVSVQALDWCNKVGSAQATVNIDTTKPQTKTLGNVSVKRGKSASFKYSITKPAGLSPTADVTIKITKSGGKVVKSISAADVPVNSDQAKSFKCTLAKGKYTWSVYATDLAGNKQKNVATGVLTVK
ncbi:MAG: hypothetical protein MUF57_09745 [Gammaproteobacteria bacterium]|jgi:hypothetical protein|nr:hypothetical protein [Gammaproteobacteria bacterium]